MNAWQELVRQALIGYPSASKLAPSLVKQLKAFGFEFDQHQMGELLLLKAAAIYNKLHAAGRALEVQADVKLAPAQLETIPYCSLQRSEQLQQIIRYQYEELLEEILNCLVQEQRLVPPALLPDLLDFGKKSQHLVTLLQQATGARGQWLAQQRPDWHYLHQVDLEEKDFFYGDAAQRLLYLNELHKQAPSKAIELLEQTWATESFGMRVRFIQILGNHLAASDEAFLEAALDDSRREVREPAASLLAQLPDSRLVQRLTSRGNDLLQLVEGKLDIQLPKQYNPALKRDGILERKIILKDHGAKANQLAQILSKIPPQHWETHFKLSPAQLLTLAAQTEWEHVLLWGWAKSAKTHQNADWILACHRFYLKQFVQQNWSNFSLDFLHQQLPNELFNQLALEYLQIMTRPTLSDNDAIVGFLLSDGQAWDDQLSLAIIQRIRTTIEQDTHVFHWGLKSLLKRAAYAISPLLYPQLNQQWPTTSSNWQSWQKEVERLLDLLKFRLEILRLDDTASLS